MTKYMVETSVHGLKYISEPNRLNFQNEKTAFGALFLGK